jgi:lambda family phage tail tape measure protein
MAKQVSEILIKLGLQGVEGLDKLKGAFRELEKSIGPNNAAIERARQSIVAYGRDSRNTEQVIKGQIDALRGLQSQVERGSSTWAQLATDIEQFRQASRRTDSELETLRQGILAVTAGTNQSQASLRTYIADLGKLRSEASLTGSTFTDLGSDIAALTARLAQAEAQTVQTSRAFGRVLGQALASTSAGARKQLQDLQLLIAEQRQAIDTIDTLSQRERRLTHNIEARADAQDRLNRSLAQQRQLTYQESIRSGREGVRAGAAAFSDPSFLTPEGVNRRFGELPNTTAALSQELNELSERLANTVRGSTAYVDVSNRIADVQRELRRELTGTAEAFERLARAQSATERRGQKVAGIQEYYSTQGPLAPGVGGYRDPVTGAMIARGARTPDRIRVDEAAYGQPIGPQAFPEAGRRAQQSIESALDDVNRIYENAKIQRAEIQTKYDNLYTEKLLQGLDLEGQIRDKAFRDELTAFDRQLEARDRKRRGRLTTGQAVQAAGAAISGGIFGGPEGFVGGVGGAILGSAIPGLGTVGGSFAGAAVGAQVGMFRQQLAGTADYAAQIGKLQIALRGIVGTQQAYEQALGAAASATRELNIPQQEAIQGLTRLSAAVLGAGGTVTDSSFAFRAMSEAVKATGGNAEQVDGAMLALTQVFSKGKVSAEELNQIAERLPGTFTLFAEAAGKTGPELQKALEQGQVGLNDLMNFLMAVRERYSATALTVASSSEEAGARLSVAFDAMRLAVGKALQPIGAELQDSLGKFITEITPGVVIGAKLIGAGFKGMLDTVKVVGSAIKGLSGIVAGLTKTLIVLGGVQAGIFVASNITTFTNALKGLVVVVRGLLSIEKALLAVESARAAVQAIIAGLSTGATKGKIAGAVLGGVAGVGVAVGLQKLIGDVVKNVSGGLDDTLKNYKADAGDLSKFDLPVSDDASKKATDKAAKDAQVAADQQQRLNETLMQQRIRMEDAVFKHQVELDKRRHDMQQERLDLEARVRLSGLSGVERQMAADYESLRKELQQLENRNREAATAVRAAQQQLTAAQQMRSVTSTGGGTVGVSTTVGINTDTITRATQAASKFNGIANQCSESVKEFYKSLGITLPGVTAWADTVRNAGTVMRDWSKLQPGDIVATGRPGDTPHVGVYTGGNNVFHQSRSRGLRAGNYPDLDYFRSGYFVRPGQTMGQGRLPGGIATQQRRATADLGDVEVARLGLQAAQTAQRDTQQQTAALRPNLIKLSISESLQPLRDQNEELQKSINLEQQRIRLVAEGFGAKQIDHLMKINEKEAERAELIAATTQVYGADTEEANIRIAETNNLYDTQIQKLERLYEIQEAPGVALQERIGTLKAEIAELADYENVIISMSQTIEQSFATAIGSAVSSLVTGAASIKQVLADMFRSIGEAFIQMAAQIIAKQVVMITLQTILKALGLTGGFSGGGGGGGLGGVSTAGVPSYALPSGPGFASGFAMAKGGVVGANGIQPFANGGIVTKPTFFKYAKGGTMQNGLMGEAGPEAIMPLKRGADGKLGVAARLDGAMKRYRSTPGSAAAAAEGDSASLAAAGAATMEPIDVRYSVERINSIDYVSADQFERGMAEAAKQGALQGERRAMRSLKNSAATRKGVGL